MATSNYQTLLRNLIACLLLAWCFGASATDTGTLLWPAVTLQQAELDSFQGQRQVTLPHKLDAQDFDATGSKVRYRLTFDLQALPLQPIGLFVSKMSLSGGVYLNGKYLGACEQDVLENLRCLHKPYLFVPPVAMWQQGSNTLEFEIYANGYQMNGLSPVLLGDADLLAREV